MKKLISMAIASAVALSCSTGAWAVHGFIPDEFADSVIEFDRDVTNAPPPHPNNPEYNALGPPDGTGNSGWFNLGTAEYQGYIIVSFDNNILIPDGTEVEDLIVWEASSNGKFNDLADVYVSSDGESWIKVGQARDYPAPVPAGNPSYANLFDIDETGLGFVKYVKLVNLRTGQGAKGFDTDAFEALTSVGTEDIVKTNTGRTEIDVGLGEPQVGFSFEIEITNNTGVDNGLNGLTFFDAVPGEFDLHGDPVMTGNCSFEYDNPEGAKKKELAKLEPELISIFAGDLLDGESCTLEVFVQTDAKTFPNGRSPAYAPTSCLEDPGTIVLNDGVKVFDELKNLLLQDDDSLTLDCNQFTD